MKRVQLLVIILVVVSIAFTSCSKDETTTTSTTKKDPVITWANPADVPDGTALSTTQLNATANVPGRFYYDPAIGKVLSVGSNQRLYLEFYPTDTEKYEIVSKTVYINVTASSSSSQFNGKTFKIISVYNGRCIDADANAISSNGTKVQLWTSIAANTNQKWNFEQVGTNSDIYKIHCVTNNRCLDAEANTINTNGTTVQLWDCISGNKNQQWRIEHIGTSIYKIHCYYNDKCLDADRNSNTNGAKLQLWDCISTNTNQQWYIEAVK